MRNPQGYAVWTHETGRIVEKDSYTCQHCNRITFVEPRQDPASLGGLCKQCMGLICPTCAAEPGCTPLLKRIEQQEARERLMQVVRRG